MSLLSPVSAGTRAEAATSDAALTRAMVAFEEALVRALVLTGIAPPTVLDELTSVCTSEGLDLHALALAAPEGGNPAIPLVDALRSRVRDPEAARWLHHGATSQDVLDTGLILVARATLDLIETDLRAACWSAAELSSRYRDTLMVGRTLTQQAWPITFGLKTSWWLSGLHDALLRVRQANRSLPVQLGGPVGNLSTYGGQGPDVLEAVAHQLRLHEPATSWHTNRTVWADVTSALSATTGAVGAVAADVLVMSQTEIGEVREAVGGPSSSMPHKANPARSVLVAAAASQVPALVSVVAASATGMANERPAGAWHAEWEPLRLALRLTGGAAARTAELLGTLRVDTEAMGRHAGQLITVLGRPAETVTADVATSGIWVDRALARWKGHPG